MKETESDESQESVKISNEGGQETDPERRKTLKKLGHIIWMAPATAILMPSERALAQSLVCCDTPKNYDMTVINNSSVGVEIWRHNTSGAWLLINIHPSSWPPHTYQIPCDNEIILNAQEGGEPNKTYTSSESGKKTANQIDISAPEHENWRPACAPFTITVSD